MRCVSQRRIDRACCWMDGRAGGMLQEREQSGWVWVWWGERALPVLGWGRFAEGSGSGVLSDCVSWGMSARHPNRDVRQAAGHELESRRAGNIKRGVVIKIIKSTGIDAFLYGKGMGEEADPGLGPLKA